MRSSPLRTGSLWRSEHIHLADISRAPDNGVVRCDCFQGCKEDDSGMYKLRNSERLRCCYTDAIRQVDGSNESDMSEAIFAPMRALSNDVSDFSDTSVSLAYSTSTAPPQYDKSNSQCDKVNSYIGGICYKCASPPVSYNSPNRRRRRRVVTRSLVLDPEIDGFHKTSMNRLNSGLSDSGVLLRSDRRFRVDSDSSSSSSNNVSARIARRKPKSQKKNTPPAYCYLGYGNRSMPPRPMYGNYLPPPSWIPVPSEDISSLQKVQELESDKKNLILQASVLADQVEAQSDKISELERVLEQRKNDLMRMEQNLHQELIAHSNVENSKIELLTELSNLRLRLTASERDRKESDDKCRKLETDLILLQTRLLEQEAEYATLRGRLSRNGTHILSHNESIIEVEKLKSALDTVIVSNDEKNKKIEDLQTSLTKYKKFRELIPSNHTRKVSDSSIQETSGFNTDAVLTYLSNDSSKRQAGDANVTTSFQEPATLSAMSSIPTHFNHSIQTHCNSASTKVLPNSSSDTSSFHKSNSVENICPSTTVESSLKSQYGTMPRPTGCQVLQQLQVRLREHEAEGSATSKTVVVERSLDSPDKSALKVRSKNSKSPGGSSSKSSGVSFAAQEFVAIPSEEQETADYVPPLSSQPHLIKTEKDKKGFLKFFSKWKRSGSQNIDRCDGDFKRGGIRATAGPRLGWSRDIPQDPDIPFNRWNTDMIADWLHKLGLSIYINECKRWMCNGDMLIKASVHEIEKELCIKNPLHRKKLILAIKGMNSMLPNLPSAINKLDYLWVVRWLDDIGLPQYKDAFADGRVDGRVLHCITVEDLLLLKVTSQLHHISIRRGIQVLREKGFEPHCLIRRSLPDEGKIYTPDLVALWSNHRVMEWLRTVDLSEYAPNLRGSGVHGALIVHEPKFNANLFATLLNIPPTKTLLRRHLATHFKHIVGDELMQIKRENETDTPLSPSVKIKVVRKTQFPLKKKRGKAESENEVYVCPMDNPVATDVPKSTEGDKLVVRRNSDPSPQEQKHLDLKEETVERIGAVSKEISTLTTMLQDENLNEAPTTFV